MQKKYRIEYIDWQGVKRHFIDDKPYNFIVYNTSDGSLVGKYILKYGQSRWLTADQMGCRFTLANVMEVDDRIWLLRTNQEYWELVLYYRNQEIWHADKVSDGVFDTLVWINSHQPDVPQEQVDLWLKQGQNDLLEIKHLEAIQTLYGADDDEA